MANIFSERFRAKRPNSSSLTAPEPDDSFTYIVGRALSVFPVCNGNNAAFLAENWGATKGLKSVIGTDKGFTFGLVNANHSVGPGKSNMVLGSIREEAWAQDGGVDIVAQIDKRACAAYDIEPEDFSNELGNFSIEIACDREQSTFVAMTNPGSQRLEDQTTFTAEEAAAQGVRRTSWAESEPYLYQDKHLVVELCSPIRCRGVAVLPDPADKTANVYEVAASLETAAKDHKPLTPGGHYADPGWQEDKKPRYPLDDADHVRSAAKFFGKAAYREEYTPEQRTHIDNAIAEAKKKFGIGDEETSGFSLADVPEATPILPNYADVDAIDVDAAMGDDMPDDAFADCYFDPDEVADKRAYPLYASARHFVESKPHPGLVKAALQAHANGKIQNPQPALQRLQVAHSLLHGAKSMDDKEKLATEYAALQSKLAEVQATIETKDTALTEKDTEIASLKDANAKLAEEVAALKSAAEAKDAEERANARFAKLAEVEGFSVKDEEKASLLESLKSEDEIAFENRVLKVKIASMEEAAKKKPAVKADEEDASLLAKVALNGLDIFPTDAPKTGEVDIYSVM